MDFIKTFADILKAMLYRLLRSRMTLVFILILVISIMCGIAALKAIGANTALSADMSATSSDITLGLSVLAAVVGFLLGGAAVENLLYSVIGLITGHPSEVRAIFDGYLAVTVSQLGYGNVLPADVLLPVLVTIAVAIAVGMLVVRRRSLA